MNRRQMLGRVLALAGAASVASAVTTEVALADTAVQVAVGNDGLRVSGTSTLNGMIRHTTSYGELRLDPGASEGALHHDLLFTPGPLTFDAMQADCAARGCALSRGKQTARTFWAFYHDTDTAADTEGITAARAFLTMSGLADSHFDVVDTWRRSLHGET